MKWSFSYNSFCKIIHLQHYEFRECSGSLVEFLTQDRRGHGFEPHQHYCVVSSSKNINTSLVLVQPRMTRPFITERLLMGLKESNQTNTIMHSYGPKHSIIKELHCIYY